MRLDLRNCDCMDLMREFPDKHFDLAIVDPPYGIGYDGQAGGKRGNGAMKAHSFKGWDRSPPSKPFFEELFRCSKNQIVWGAGYMIDNLPPSPCWLSWDKVQSFTGADFELAWTSLQSPSKSFRMSRIDAYVNEASSGQKIHPTQKPVALYRWLLHNYAKPGDKILDTHLGSGSIAIACHEKGFDLTGSELDPDYFAAMQKRLAEATAQIGMGL